jgi:hypothetical protein
MSKDNYILDEINKYNNINTINIQNIKRIVTDCINKIFIKLIENHKILLIDNLTKVVNYVIYFFNIKKNYIDQFTMNNYQDIYSLLILLIPFYDLNKSNEIQTFDELFKNEKDSAKKLSSSYYVDHQNLIKSKDYLNEYFENVISSIIKTLDKISTKLLPNWRNIFPYDMYNFIESDKYKYYIRTFKNRDFNKYNSGYFYSIVYKFLYIDIKDIKWMIFDHNNNNNSITPYILRLSNKLNMNDIIVNKSWDYLDKNKQQNLINEWNSFIKIKDNFNIVKSLILFYLRWESDLEKIKNFKIEEKYKSIIKKFKFETNEDNEEEIILTENELGDCVKTLIPQIEFKNLYNYIYESIQQFKYTWYGYICLDNDQNILNEEDYFINYSNKYAYFLKTEFSTYKDRKFNKYLYVTPKNIYNFFKSLLHLNSKSEEGKNNYKLISKSYEWDSIDEEKQNIIISRLKMKDVNTWFNISKNLGRIYNEKDSNDMYEYIIQSFENKDSDLLVNIIFETLVYNGMLTYFKYNPRITDNNIIPNKNKEYKKWEKYMLENVTLNEYKDSYHFFSNKKYSNEFSEEYKEDTKNNKINKDNINPLLSIIPIKKINSLDIIKKSRWYTNFGSDWIAQIQLYHHFLNQRVFYITGATGAGKSTVAPFALVYAIKMLNYNNNAKIVCTVPRIQPAEDNSKQISSNIGIPINKDKEINYIQFETQEKKIIDNSYHPKLILATDGLLYQRIKSNYLLKNKAGNKNISTNIYDMILIDEAHEHNVYMDMILTLCKFGIYINNQVSLGIISATMDEDELIYRKYFEIINDNMKWPLSVNDEYNKIFLDRRIHLSVPFGGMNFYVEEINRVNSKPEEVIKDIIKNTYNGDILLFLPGRGEITKAVKNLNEVLPYNVLAIPFYSELDKVLLERVKRIAEPGIRKLFRYPKSKNIEDMDKLKKEELLAEGIYKRFIIIATNIAEASITIDSLEYVADTGTQKINKYNVKKDIEELKSEEISKPNKTQRKGRVGRVKPGKFYYTYDITKLNDRVIFKICIENIQDMLYGLYNTNDGENEENEENEENRGNEKNKSIKLIDKSSDPNKVRNKNNIKDFLLDQYLLSNDEIKINKEEFINDNDDDEDYNIIYPDNDGKYDLKTLIDEKGKFYIIHPDEDLYTRDINLKIVKKPEKNYENKVKKIFENGKINGYIDKDNQLTDEYKLLEKTLKLTTTISDKIKSKHVNLLYDILINNYDINSEVMNKILLFVLFVTGSYKLDVNKKISGNADFLVQANTIPNYLYEYTDYEKLQKYIRNLSDIYFCIKTYIDFKLKNNPNIKEDVRKLLVDFYKIKLYFKIIIDPNENLFLKKDIIIDQRTLSIDKDIRDTNILYYKIKDKIKETLNIKSYSIYDQLCYFIIRSFQSFLLIKISDSDYYVNYKNTDVNQIFSLTTKDTQVLYNNINRIILTLNIQDPMHVRNIMWIPEYLIHNLKIKKNIYNDKINMDQLKKTYDIYDYKNIKKKIDKVIKYIEQTKE